MKAFLLVATLLRGITAFEQTPEQDSILELSKKVFQWEIGNKIDSWLLFSMINF
jgi:hypothetical protein